MQACALLRLQGTKPDFHPSEKQTIVSIRCRYVPIIVKIRLRPIGKCNFRQIYLCLFANASNQWAAKMMMGRSEYSENLFYPGLQQHSSYGVLVYCFAVLLLCCRTGLQQQNIKLKYQQWSADLEG